MHSITLISQHCMPRVEASAAERDGGVPGRSQLLMKTML